MSSTSLRGRLRRPLRRAPEARVAVTNAEKYVTAAYAVVLAVVLLYVVIYAFKMARLSREVAELAELAARREREAEPEHERAPVA